MKIALGLLIAGTLLSGAGAVQTAGQKKPPGMTGEGAAASARGHTDPHGVGSR